MFNLLRNKSLAERQADWALSIGATIIAENPDRSIDLAPIIGGTSIIVYDHIGLKYQINKVHGNFCIRGRTITSLAMGPRHVTGAYILDATLGVTSLSTMSNVIAHDLRIIGSLIEINNLHNIHKALKKCQNILISTRIVSHVLGTLLIPGLRTILLVDDVTTVKTSFSKRQYEKLRQAISIITKHLAHERDLNLCQEEMIDAGLAQFAKL